MIILNTSLFLIGIIALFFLQRKKVSFNFLVLLALIAGIILGIVLHNFDDTTISESMRWISIVGTLYVRLLRMMVIPLIFVSIVCAIINQTAGKSIKKATAIILIVLLGTTAIAAVVGGLTATSFQLTSEGLEIGESEAQRTEYIEERSETMANLETTIIEIVPTNPFYALTGQGTNATLSVVFFAVLLGIGVLQAKTYASEQADFFKKLFNSLNTIVVELVMMIVMLTPYGIFSLITNTVASSDYTSILRLAKFVIASYVAIFIMFLIHGIILAFLGLNPITFFKKSMATLIFAFTSRTSAGTLPLTIRSLHEDLGVSEGIANLAPSLGTSIGQNGCAAIYPAMLVVMVAPTVGQPITPSFFLLMVVVITFASIGIAGVGGGATFAGITVLTALGLPVGIAGLLIAVEPLIDMARTALNVSGSMISALAASKVTGDISIDSYNEKIKL
ncbi:MAG: cation:dicarboxylate symporter family transporter [Lachnospiraceae bacterium]